MRGGYSATHSCVYFWSFHHMQGHTTSACMCAKYYDLKWHEVFVFYAASELVGHDNEQGRGCAACTMHGNC